MDKMSIFLNHKYEQYPSQYFFDSIMKSIETIVYDSLFWLKKKIHSIINYL